MIMLIGLGFVAIGILFFVLGRRASREGKRQRSWPVTNGTVTSAALGTVHGGPDRRRGPGYVPQIGYDYEVAGKRYSASRIGVVPSQGYTRVCSEQLLAQYQPGTTVSVHYDPADPATATLRPAAKGGGFIVALGVIFIVVGAPVLLLGLALGG